MRRWPRILLPLAILALSPGPAGGDEAAAEGKCSRNWIFAEATVVLTSGGARYIAQDVARDRALAQAELKAIETACDKVVQSERRMESRGDSRFKVQSLAVSTYGIVDDREILASAPVIEGGVAKYHVEICARCLCDEPKLVDAGFLVDLELVGSDAKAVATLRAGEAFRVVATPTRDVYLTILDVYRDERGELTALQLYPNDLDGETQALVRADETFTFPASPDEFLQAALQPGFDESEEDIWVIATRSPFTFAKSKATYEGDGTYVFDAVREDAFREKAKRLFQSLEPSERTIRTASFAIKAH